MLEINDEVLEWEILQKTITVDKIAPNINIHRKTVSIIVNRNDSYQIEAILTAIIEVPVRERSDYEYLNRLYMNPLGSPKELFTIEGSDQFGSKIELRNCYIIEHSSTDSESDSETIVTLKIRVQEILIDQNIESKLSWLSEWYINGPVDVDFPGETVRYRDEKSDKTSRKRVTVDISYDEALKNIGKTQGNLDFAIIDSESAKFIIAKVPSNFGPSWSKSMCIEYRKDFGPIPDLEQREAISEIVSFVLGTQLLSVGFTEYDSEGRISKSVAKSVWGGTYSRFISEDVQASPFDLGRKEFIRNPKKIEKILVDLIPKYLNLRKKLNLKHALWRYWISKSMPLGTNLPVLSSGLEIIMKSWFNSENSQSKAFYISKKEFNKILRENSKDIEKKLDDIIENKIKSLELEEIKLRKKQEYIELKNQVVNKIRSSNQMSITKKYQVFFKEIGLRTGDMEEKVLKSRNSMAHPDEGSLEEVEKMKMCTRTYQTLFHRIFLKILRYKGNYVDRSIIGFPAKHIDEPLGEKRIH
jgi:hypothetical protein